MSRPHLKSQPQKPTGAAYAQAREQDKQRKKAIRDQRRAAAEATREEDAELAAQMKASARLNGEVGFLFRVRKAGASLAGGGRGRLGRGGWRLARSKYRPGSVSCQCVCVLFRGGVHTPWLRTLFSVSCRLDTDGSFCGKHSQVEHTNACFFTPR